MQSPSCTVTDAFNSQLKALCIKEFPCGYGTWRIPDFENTTKTANLKSQTENTPISRNELTAQYETIEGLQELSIKPPYNIEDCSWSNEASSLREIAVKTPNKLSHDFILNYFKSLRIVDKMVTEIDEGLLKFKNLTKFTLSANLISNVDSKRLPSELQELELSANQISDISPLCISPPPLIHLGLGYNDISSIPCQMKPESWGHLLSLDVSCNNLLDLNATINILKLLPKLRNLVLQGNPLMLVPGYRGYIIDSIRQLTILDDNRISADEKHYFKGLSKLKDISLDKSQLTMSVSTITGVKLPDESEDQENQPEFPKILYKYHVEFKFLEQPYEAPATESHSGTPTPTVLSNVTPREEPQNTQSTECDNNADLQLIATNSFPWNEEAIELEYSKDFHTHKLSELRDFLKNGIEFNVIETKHSYVQEDPNAMDDDGKLSTSGGKDSKAEKRKKSGKEKGDKDKRKESAKTKDKGKEGKGKGKGKHEEIELFELPRESRTLGSCHVALSTFLDGEVEVRAECVCEGDKEETKTDDTKSVNSGKQEGNDKKKANKGETADKSNKGAKHDGKKGGKEAAGKKGGKDDKGKGKAAKEEETTNDDEDDMAPPPPLSINVCIRLHQWKSAKEATLACSTGIKN